ncbi:acid phosphatase type 7-like [Ruditapes philippinarum]|uniref:acid phosphatase type 7-like n=1 Tax=Ruditapes philippinarum TaxID=129788 RepID=UPI00295C23DA|nr:acid phosphatase type 7-like [Ruditapes philippinarum]
MKLVLLNVLIFSAGIFKAVSSRHIPEQIHISYGDTHDSIVVMWSSRDHVTWDVHYGISPSAMEMTSQSRMATLPNTHSKAAKYIYRSTLKNLTLATTYFYKIVSKMDQPPPIESEVFSFQTLPGENERNTTSRFIVYGDMGAKMSNMTRAAIENLRRTQSINAVLHVGDFAYDLHSEDGKVGDIFMEEIQSFAAELPYMTAPGNHEIAEDFKSYRNRFSTPNTPWPIPLNKMWYSFDVGLVHFIR